MNIRKKKSLWIRTLMKKNLKQMAWFRHFLPEKNWDKILVLFNKKMLVIVKITATLNLYKMVIPFKVIR